MVRATGAGAYSRNSLGVVIVFGMIVSTVLGRFVIPIYYVLGERVIDSFTRLRGREEEVPAYADGHRGDGVPARPDSRHADEAHPVSERQPNDGAAGQ
jgi:hypothetical protein